MAASVALDVVNAIHLSNSATAIDTGVIWNNWATTATAATTDGVVFGGTTSTTGDSFPIWIKDEVTHEIIWRSGVDSNMIRGPNITWYPPYVPDSRHKAANIEVRAQRRRARNLLREILNPEQYRDLASHGSVRVVGSDGGIYDVCPNEIFQIDAKGEAVVSMCWGHGAAGYCTEDRMGAIILKLMANERTFLSETCRSSITQETRDAVKARRYVRDWKSDLLAA